MAAQLGAHWCHTGAIAPDLHWQGRNGIEPVKNTGPFSAIDRRRAKNIEGHSPGPQKPGGRGLITQIKAAQGHCTGLSPTVLH